MTPHRLRYDLQAWGAALRWGLLAGYAAYLAVEVGLIAAGVLTGWQWR